MTQEATATAIVHNNPCRGDPGGRTGVKKKCDQLEMPVKPAVGSDVQGERDERGRGRSQSQMLRKETEPRQAKCRQRSIKERRGKNSLNLAVWRSQITLEEIILGRV